MTQQSVERDAAFAIGLRTSHACQLNPEESFEMSQAKELS
jgi:hypothetical protein